ncbi:Kinesin-like protein kif19 [Halocaridina rubra]|uniref:Kinesin-like protein n=1 Tax=Halocaridina rubra TaxID=373956 RepID=A0AAN8WNT7_HALRR
MPFSSNRSLSPPLSPAFPPPNYLVLPQVNVRQAFTKGDNEEIKDGRLFMVDLAGSERAKQTQNKGKRLQEGAHINRALLALGNCINALAEGRAKYVNYRDSKLTRLLKDALSGNCRTVMIAHVSPCHVHREETRNTLVYADRAKNISKNVLKNVAVVSYDVSQYQTIICELKDEIERLKGKMTTKDVDKPSNNKEAEEERLKNNEMLRKIKNDLLEHFREQMSLRNKLMDIDSNILALSMEFERQNLVITEWETERARKQKKKIEPEKGPDGEEVIDMETDKDRDEDSDEEEPEEVAQAWEDLMYLQKEKQRYTEMREKVEQEMQEMRERATEMEEALPNTITTDEQRELLELLCKVHELEIQKMEMQSEALLKEHELRRRDLLILRYDRQRTLCDEIITRQRQMIEDLNPTMPPELQELYSLYQMELQYTNNDRDVRYLNDINMIRSSSMLSLRAPSFERLPPINNKEPEKLFDKPQRRYSLGEERRPESALTLRSPISSASSSAPGTASGSRVPSLPPILGALPSNSLDPDGAEVRHGLKGINAIIARRRRLMGLKNGNRHSSLDALDQIKNLPDSPNGLTPMRRRPRNTPPVSRGNLLTVQSVQSRRRSRGGSASSSDGDSPAPRSTKYHRMDPPKPNLRKRGKSLSRIDKNLNQPGIWTSSFHPTNNKRRQSHPPRRGRAKSPDVLGQVGFALHY